MEGIKYNSDIITSLEKAIVIFTLSDKDSDILKKSLPDEMGVKIFPFWDIVGINPEGYLFLASRCKSLINVEDYVEVGRSLQHGLLKPEFFLPWIQYVKGTLSISSPQVYILPLILTLFNRLV